MTIKFYMEDEIYLERIKDMLDESLIEIGKFKDDNKRHHLLQAGEKTYNAITNLSYLLNQNEIRRHEDVREFYYTTTKINNNTARDLIGLGDKLHANFYRDFYYWEDLERDVLKAKEIINNILKRYKK